MRKLKLFKKKISDLLHFSEINRGKKDIKPLVELNSTPLRHDSTDVCKTNY